MGVRGSGVSCFGSLCLVPFQFKSWERSWELRQMEDAGSADMRQADEEPSTQWLLDNLQTAARDPFRNDGQQDFPSTLSTLRRSRSRSRSPSRSPYRFFSERNAHLANVCSAALALEASLRNRSSLQIGEQQLCNGGPSSSSSALGDPPPLTRTSRPKQSPETRRIFWGRCGGARRSRSRDRSQTPPPPERLPLATLEVPSASVAHPPTALASAAPPSPSLSSLEYIDAVIDQWQAEFDAPATVAHPPPPLARAPLEVPSVSSSTISNAAPKMQVMKDDPSTGFPGGPRERPNRGPNPQAQFSSTEEELDWEIEHWSDPR